MQWALREGDDDTRVWSGYVQISAISVGGMQNRVGDDLGFAAAEVSAQNVRRRDFVVHNDCRLEHGQHPSRSLAFGHGAHLPVHPSGHGDLVSQRSEQLDPLDLARQDQG
jgi:hypothetical protein